MTAFSLVPEVRGNCWVVLGPHVSVAITVTVLSAVSWFQKSSVPQCYVSWLRPVASVVLRSESAVGPGDVNMTK